MATADRLYAVFGGKQFSTELQRSDDPSRHSFPKAFFIENGPTNSVFVHKVGRGFECFALSESGARRIVAETNIRGLCGWVEDSGLYILGMRTRRRRFGRSWFWLKRGLGALVRIEVDRAKSHVLYTDTHSKLLTTELARQNPATIYPPNVLRVEAWLTQFPLANARILLGGVADVRPREHDDTFENPDASDFAGIALFQYIDGATQFQRLLSGYTFLQNLPLPHGGYLYVRDSRSLDRSSNGLACLSYDRQVSEAPQPLVFEGIDATQRITACSFTATSVVTLCRCRDDDRHSRHHSPVAVVLHSADGLVWAAAHPLANVP